MNLTANLFASLPSWNQQIAAAIISLSWQVAVAGLVLWFVLRWVPRSRAQLRYAAGCLLFFSIPVGLAVQCFVAATGESLQSSQVSVTGTSGAPKDPTSVETAETTFTAWMNPIDLGRRDPSASSLLSVNDRKTMDPASDHAATSVIRGWFRGPIGTWENLAAIISTLYLLGLSVMLIRCAAGVYLTQRLRRRSRMIQEDKIKSLVKELAQQLKLRVTPVVKVCEQVVVPMVVGVIKPMILLPASISTSLSSSELEAVLLHELAHIRRWDPLVNFIQRVVESILFFHPVAWWMSRQIAQERENCCDDIAAQRTDGGVAYASTLIRLAEICLESKAAEPSPALSGLGAAGRNPSQLRQRIERQLTIDAAHRSGWVSWITMASLVCLTTGFVWVTSTRPSADPLAQTGGSSLVSPLVAVQSKKQQEKAKGTTAKSAAAILDNKPKDNKPRAEKQIDDKQKSGKSKLDFLQPYRELHELSLEMTRDQFLQIVQANKFTATPSRDQSFYSIETGDGFTVIVMFESGKPGNCKGIQRIPGGRILKPQGSESAASKDKAHRDRDSNQPAPPTNGNLSELAKVDLAGKQVNAESLAKLSGRHFEEVTLRNATLNGKLVRLICAAGSIKNLRIFGIGLSGQVNRLQNLSGLIKLEIGAPLLVEDLKAIGQLQQLQSLSLPKDLALTVTGAKQIARLVKLQELRLYGVDVDDASFVELATLTNLRRLDLSHTRVTDLGLKTLTNMRQLTHLELTRYSGEEQISDLCLETIAKLTELQRLSLSGKVSDQGLARVVKLPNLTSLAILNTRITPGGLKNLADSKIQSLTVPAGLLRANVKFLEKCRHLKHINVIGDSHEPLDSQLMQSYPDFDFSFSG